MTARLAAGERSEPCEPEVKCTLGPVPAATVMTFNAAPNQSYSILYKDSITGAWLKLADEPAQASARLVQVVDPLPPVRTRFYRLVTPMSQ